MKMNLAIQLVGISVVLIRVSHAELFAQVDSAAESANATPPTQKWEHILAEPEPAANALAARNALAKRQAQAAIALLRLDHSDPVWPLFQHSADPTLRSYLIREVGASGISAKQIINRLEIESDVSARRALILTLGGFSNDQLPPERRNPITARLLSLYRQDPDPGIHSAIDWLLRHRRQGLSERKVDWDQSEILARIDQESAGKPFQNRSWLVSKSGHTFAVMHGAIEFKMGAPLYEPGREKTDEPPHPVRIPRSFAIAIKEVTVGEFQLFLDANPSIKKRAQAAGKKDPTRAGQIMKRLNLDDDCPQILMTWFEAAQYCNWLSQQEGIPEQEWCYPALEQIAEGMTLPTNYLHRTGYRLPTEAEWEYVSRAGAATARFFGSPDDLLPEYAWYTGSTFNERPWPVGQLKPNDFGLFDVYGNVWEWGQDLVKTYSQEVNNEVKDDTEDKLPTVSKDQPRPRKGGSYTYGPEFMRSAYRNRGYIPDERRDSVGFRVARTIPQ